MQTYPTSANGRRPRPVLKDSEVVNATIQHVLAFVWAHSQRGSKTAKSLKHLLQHMHASAVLLSPSLWALGLPIADRAYEKSKTIMLDRLRDALQQPLEPLQAVHKHLRLSSPHSPLVARDGSHHSGSGAGEASAVEELRFSLAHFGERSSADESSENGGVPAAPSAAVTSARNALAAAAQNPFDRRCTLLAAICDGMQRAILGKIAAEAEELERRFQLPSGFIDRLSDRPERFKVQHNHRNETSAYTVALTAPLTLSAMTL